MVPMLDPIVPETTLLLAISPAFVGVVLTLVAAAATAIAGTVRELHRGERRQPESTFTPAERHKTALRAA
jgi:hypothetical protein